MSDQTAFFPEQVPIDAYGNGGFRFAGGSHKGSLICLPSGIYGWDARSMDDVNAALCAQIVAESVMADFVLMGTGVRQIFPTAEQSAIFDNVDLVLEVMDTGAACRTYNLMMDEQRAVMAAFIAVE